MATEQPGIVYRHTLAESGRYWTNGLDMLLRGQFEDEGQICNNAYRVTAEQYQEARAALKRLEAILLDLHLEPNPAAPAP